MDVEEVKERAMRGLGAIPDVGRLLVALMRDPRVPRRTKLLLGGAAAYVVLPGDLLPDWIPGLGAVDDLMLVALALDALFNHVDEEVVREHYRGDPEVLAGLQQVLAMASNFVPSGVKDRLLGEPSE